jgi:hypothetical protein
VLAIAKSQIVEGYQVHDDFNDPTTFYVIPNSPRFRLDDHGKPVFKYVKYRFPVDREDGKKGGGYVFFDVAFDVPDADLERIRAALQAKLTTAGGQPPEIKVSTPPYLRGRANFLLKNSDGTLIESVMGAASPSLFGKCTAAYALELTSEGATLFEATMKGEGVGGVIIEYELTTTAALPPLTACAWFHGHEFYSYFQQVDIDRDFWNAPDSYRETIREAAYSSESMGVTVDMQFVLPEGPEATAKLRDSIRASMKAQLEDAVARKALKAIDPVAADKRDLPKDSLDHLIRDFQVTKDVWVDDRYTENGAIEWTIHPSGNLPNITTMTGPDGKPFKWEDYYVEVKVDDPFFQQLNVAIGVNADFENLPLHSVEVHLDYHEGNTHQIGEYSFRDASAQQKFASYIENDNWTYQYWYEVNYKGASKKFTSKPETVDDKILTIGLDEVGVLHAEFEAGAIDWSQVNAVQIAFEYAGRSVKVAETLVLTEKSPTASVIKAILEARDKAYVYTVTYAMADGRELKTGPQEGTSGRTIINDVFQTKTIPIRVAGDLSFDDGDDPAKVIDEILLHVRYTDVDGLSQETDVALNAEQTFLDWKVPVVGTGDGIVAYSGHIKFHNGTTVEIEETTPTVPTILVGDVVASKTLVTVAADLVDFSEVKLVKVSLKHGDHAQDFMFRPGGATEATFELDSRKKGDVEYQWAATYYMTDATRRTAKDTTTELTLMLEIPPAGTPAQPATQPVG